MREDELPDLQDLRAETAGAAQQIVPPHAVEAHVLGGVAARPFGLEVVVPGDEGLVVVRADVVDVDHGPEAVDGLADLGDRGDDAAGEDVLFEPGLDVVSEKCWPMVWSMNRPSPLMARRAVSK